MGILVQNNEERSRLGRHVAADLRARSTASSRPDGRNQDVDLVEDSVYLKDSTKTSRFSWFWFILILLAVISLIVIFVLK